MFRHLWNWIVRYFRWSLGRRTWWGKTLAFGGPVLAALMVISAAGGDGEGRDPGSPPQSVVDAPAKAPRSPALTAALESGYATTVPLSTNSTLASGEPPLTETLLQLTATSTPAPLPPTPMPAPPNVPFAQLRLTEDNVKAALASKNLISVPFDLTRPESIEVGSGQVLLTYLWDYADKLTDLMSNGGYAAYDASRVLFANPRVMTVAVKIRSHYVDRLGNTIVEPSTIAVIRRSTADQTNWDGLGVLVLRDNKHMFCAADSWFIHSIVYDSLKDKGCLLKSWATRLQ